MQLQAAAAPAKVFTFDRMLETVRYEGAYPTRERAEESVTRVLTAFGQQLADGERASLAAQLPAEAARLLGAAAPAEPLSGQEFVKELATRTGGTPATTRWDTSTVLTLVGHIAGSEVLTRVLAQLPPGYALLFGRAELTQVARQRREGIALPATRRTVPLTSKFKPSNAGAEVATAGR
ncbi:hypothetical protein GCM10011583_24970 [Streptomyces camponoticapitis]|uniref:DUF2267 domain-containing protein n=1 Tax=Streptomyces camponoticapitis TaxID=1616125 RepID=A0ABQ2E3F1_9ACTN|nr:hypothetical protein GCM10011583_24970 [Streptomyces camponoticapitis]